MKKQNGIWIDTERAYIVNLEDDEPQLTKMESGIETRERYPGEERNFGQFGETFIDYEKKKEHRLETNVHHYLEDVKARVKEADELIIFGPAQMKKHLEKLLKEDKNFKPQIKGVENADKMSEHQLVAWVKSYFTKN